VAKLSLTPGSGTAPVTVTASTSGSTDPQGSALTSTINFGDGASAAGSTATHTYNNPGTYTVTATVTDAFSKSSQATATVTAGSAPLISISQPANNSTVHSPVHIVASGTAPSGVGALQIYLDNTLVYQANAGSFDTTVAAAPGLHYIVVQLWDQLGNYYKQPLNVTVIPNLVTSLSLSAATIAAGDPVTATISAISGNMISSSINWGDGTTSAGPSATHAYSAAGSYAITGTASDAAGSVQSTTNVTVEPIATVVLQSPLQGATVPLSMHIKGYASSPIGIASLQVYIDSRKVYQSATGSVDGYFKASAGTHTIKVQARDTAGFTYQSVATVTVSSNALNSMLGR
jgi:PKD repeat protein